MDARTKRLRIMNATVWMSVSTPIFFQEIEVPEDPNQRTPNQLREIEELENAAERHCTHIETSKRRRG